MKYLSGLTLGISLVLGACGGSGGSSSNSAAPTSVGSVTVGNSRGLISGGVGRSDGTGVPGIGLVGVSGSGLVVGVSGSGMSLGSIQDFGSIILNDRAIDTDTATVSISGDTALLADLRQGQQVLVIQDAAGDAVHVSYRPNLVAPLESVVVDDLALELGGATALGQSIEFNAATVYEGTELAALAAGDLVEVSGIPEANGTLLATFVRQTSGVSAYTLTGNAEAVTNSSFSIQGRGISYDPSNLVGFEDNQLEPGDVVEVRFEISGYDPNASLLASESVELLDRLLVDEAVLVSSEGVIESFDSVADFVVQEQRVSVSAGTQIFGGDVDDLVEGLRVLAVGTIDSEDTLIADEIYLETDDTVLVEGPLTALDLAQQTVTVLGITFAVRDLTDFDGVDGLEDLATGDQLEVAGYVDGASIIAADIEREGAGELGGELRGPVAQFDGQAGTLEIFDVPITTVAGTTTFEGFAEEILTQAEFFDQLTTGVFASASWNNFSATSEAPDMISLEDD